MKSARPKELRRNSIRYRGYDYTQPGAYFVTIVATDHKWAFGKIINTKMRESELGMIISDCWQQIPIHFPLVEVDPFVIMPNHIHGIITLYESDCRGTIYRAPTTTVSRDIPVDQKDLQLEKFGKPVRGSIPTIIRTFKAAVSRIAKRKLGMHNVWQRGYYEHIIRNPSEMEKIGEYIHGNPDLWVDDPEYIP